jgi:diacylglycerol kinase (ATP)
MFVVLNTNAGGGRAVERWRRIAPLLERGLGPFTLCPVGDITCARSRVAAALMDGERQFVAAGGDGTVNRLFEDLVETAPPGVLCDTAVGAIALGSSNDFHKPRAGRPQTGGIPARLDFVAAQRADLGVLVYLDVAGAARRRFWINNASIGVTADGNYRFNHPDRVLKGLKRIATGASIAYATLAAVVCHRPRVLTLWEHRAASLTLPISNLGVVKNPHFAGSLRYDSPHEPASGSFHVHVLEGSSLPHLLPALWGLAHGRFAGRRGSRSWRASQLVVRAPEPFPVEVDGEVVVARQACFTILPRCVRVCP